MMDLHVVIIAAMRNPGDAYPLLGQLTGTLILRVAEQLDHTLLIGSKTIVEQTTLAAVFSIAIEIVCTSS